MARHVNDHDLTPLLHAAQQWIASCLIEDGALFVEGRAVWTAANADRLQHCFVDRPDSGDDDFFVKLKRQLEDAGTEAQWLAAEMMWALQLFASNLGQDGKRRAIVNMWSWSGSPLDAGHPLLRNEVLVGVGSGGQGFLQYRWRELAYLIALVRSLKAMQLDARRAVLTDYDRFMDWMESVPRDGDRQFRHMLRYFAFPDRVERMTSNRDRVAVLEGFQVATGAELRRWSDRQLDEELLKLRQGEEARHPGQVLDFYEGELRSRWRKSEQEAAAPPASAPTTHKVSENMPERSASASVIAGPVNKILYGPPGTGKTYWLRERFAEYTDAPNQVDEATWLTETLAGYGWRCVIAAALADLGRPARVPEVRDHKWVKAKAQQRGRTLSGVNATLWGYLQEHTPPSSTTVNITVRREPFLFDKQEAGGWHLLKDWQDRDDEAAELWRLLKAGPKAATEPVQRYKVVTFHPSFSYEDFVRGIRPVANSEDGTTQFRLVDGVFKQICDEAHANPGQRYALFIDEINRANIAKVFGELITLIEPDKRATFDAHGRLVAGMAVQLPGSTDSETAERRFGVPRNLDIYGTMNTADRSIALLDVALRRRFEFEERMPSYSPNVLSTDVEGIDVGKMLRRINDRLEFLLDRNHGIGHAYLMHAKSLVDIQRAFERQIIPLLQEYFFDDFARVGLVLSTTGEHSFVHQEPQTFNRLFSGQRLDGLPAERARHFITAPGSWTVDSFRGIYEERNA
ncbi:MAG: McrB family protein [Roseateles sp.]|uniref:McrB family protein n=1 Tax=Roseateles sp. TaxID=1971397 RepID=UPI0040363E32